MRKLMLVIAVGVLGLSLVACGNADKTAAQTAIKAAQDAYDAAKDQLTKLMPDEAKSIEDAIATAQASFDKGDYKAATDAVKDVPSMVQNAQSGMAAKETELKGQWDALSAGLPDVLATIQKRVDVLSKSTALPAGLDASAFDSAKQAMTSATQTWADAQTAYQNGMLADAVSKAQEVKKTAAEVMTSLNMKVPPALM